MNIREDINKIKDRPDHLTLSQVMDTYERFQRTGRSSCSKFLNDRELGLVEGFLKKHQISYKIKRLNQTCEKSIVYFGEYENFISVFYIRNKNVKHKDVLGALFSIGYNAKMIGDIFIQNGVYITNLKLYDPVLESSLIKIGKYRVDLEQIDELPEIKMDFGYIELHLNSTRLDLIISHLAHISRSEAINYIRRHCICVNYKEVKKQDILLHKGDILSIEKVGKFKIVKEEKIESKDKVLVGLERYI